MEISSPDEIVQVRHNPVFPDKGMGTVRTAEGNAHHLTPPVDGEGFAEEVSAERAEILSLVGASGPEEGVRYEVALRVARADRVGKPDDVTGRIDVHGCVPGRPSQVGDGGHRAVFPEHGVTCAEASHRYVAIPRDAHRLALVVDRSGCRGRVARERRELLHRALLRLP